MGYALFFLFLVVCNLFRVAIFVGILNGSVRPVTLLDPIANGVVICSELTIRLAGLIALSDLLRATPWGFWSTLGINGYAIAFDAWAAIAVQASAAGGVVPPALTLVLLVRFHRWFIQQVAARSPAAPNA